MKRLKCLWALLAYMNDEKMSVLREIFLSIRIPFEGLEHNVKFLPQVCFILSAAE